MKTLYHVLGVPFDAIGSQIDGAYRSECAKLDAEALDGETRAGRRRSLDHAHQTLTNSLARMEYDEKLIKLKAMKAPQPAFGSAASSESVWSRRSNRAGIGLIFALIIATFVAAKMYYDQAQRVEMQKRQARIEAEQAEQERLRAASFERERLNREQLEREIEARRQAQQEARDAQERERSFRNGYSEQQRQRDQSQTERNARARVSEMEMRSADAAERARIEAQRSAEANAARERTRLRAVCIERYGRPDC